MTKTKNRNMFAMVAILCVAVLASTSLVALVGSTNDADGASNGGSGEVTYEKLCGVVNADGNLRNAKNTHVDGNGYVITVCNGSSNRDGEFSCNYLTYKIYPGDRVKVVGFSSDTGNIRSFSIPDYIDFNGTRYTVTEVDEWGMACGQGLKYLLSTEHWAPLRVDVGPSIAKINKSAFSGASSALEHFIIRNIEKSNLYKIEERAFSGMKVKTIELPKSLQIIEKGAFADSSVDTVILNSETLDIGYQAFYLSHVRYVNLENVRHIGSEAFWGTKLTDLDLSSATEVGEGAFICDDTIKSVKFSSALTSLHEKAFGWIGTFGWFGMIGCQTYHFYDTVGNEMGQCAELMHGKTFVRNGDSCNFNQTL